MRHQSQYSVEVQPRRTNYELSGLAMRSSLIFLLSILIYSACDVKKYYQRRSKLIEDEFKLTLGAKLNLTENENIVNECLMRYKKQELDYAFDHQDYFNLSRHYFTYKKSIQESKVYKILKDMPKGAVLHIHDKTVLGPDYLMDVTYLENLYVCFGDRILFQFSLNAPKVLVPRSGN